MTDAELFLNYIGENYDRLKNHLKKYSLNKIAQFDEGIFHQTILRCYENIEKKMYLQDPTAQGIENFLFKAFANNIIREKQYARVAKRVETDNLSALMSKNDKEDDGLRKKLEGDLKEDFSILYILEKIEKALSYEHCHLFALKHLNGMTYSAIARKTKGKGSRDKILEAANYVRENITKDEIDKAFSKFYEQEIG